MGSSRTRALTRVPCIGRRILNHCTTREVQFCEALKIFLVNKNELILNNCFKKLKITSSMTPSLHISPCAAGRFPRSLSGSGWSITQLVTQGHTLTYPPPTCPRVLTLSDLTHWAGEDRALNKTWLVLEKGKWMVLARTFPHLFFKNINLPLNYIYTYFRLGYAKSWKFLVFEFLCSS